jgi:hypothetical protein
MIVLRVVSQLLLIAVLVHTLLVLLYHSETLLKLLLMVS